MLGVVGCLLVVVREQLVVGYGCVLNGVCWLLSMDCHVVVSCSLLVVHCCLFVVGGLLLVVV